MSTTFDATVPEGLTELLEEFAISVLKERPKDLVQFAAHYFQNLHMSRQQTGGGGGSDISEQPVRMDVENESEEEDLEPPLSYREAMTSRRKSVFGESYEPDDEELPEKVVHPKSDSQRRRLIESVKKIFLFKSLDTEQTNEVLDAMFEKKVNRNDKVIVQGDDGDNFYVVDSGTFDVFVTRGSEGPKLVFNYNDEGSFGELALMYNTPRAATVVATSTGVLWALDRTTFRRIICGAASRKREMYQSFLESVPMLKTLEPYELLNLADALEKKQFGDGQCIIKQGDQASSFYIVECGTVKIFKEDPVCATHCSSLAVCVVHRMCEFQVCPD
jgi:cAMP-dependent protein kinase regulator